MIKMESAKTNGFTPKRPKHSASARRLKRLGIVGALIAVIGTGLAVKGGFETSRAMASKRWPSTAGTVIHADVYEVRHHNEEYRGSTYYPKVVYRYTVYGESYTAARLTFGGEPGSNQTGARKVVDSYPVGMPLTVYYDPNDPAVAVLNIGTSPMAYGMVGAGMTLIVIGGGCLLAWKRYSTGPTINSGR